MSHDISRKVYKYLYAIGVYLFLYLPIGVVVLLSFNDAKRSLVWHGFTLRWYKALFQDSALLEVMWHSLILGVLAATLATIIGTLIAISLFRYQFRGKKLVHGLVFILIITPEIVTTISLLLLYNFFQISPGFITLLFGHTALCVPFVAVVVYGRITTLDHNIFEAAVDLGASDYLIFRKILIPLLFPAIFSGWLLSFTLSLDDIITSYFVSGPTYEILPLKIYSMVRLGVKPEVNALCTLMLLFTLLMVVIGYQGIFRRRVK